MAKLRRHQPSKDSWTTFLLSSGSYDFEHLPHTLARLPIYLWRRV